LGAALVASWAMLALEGAPRDLGFGLRRRAALEVGFGLVAGTAGVLAVVAALTLAGVYRFEPEPGTVSGWLGVAGGSLIAFAIPAAAEEAVFRGYALRALREAGGTVAAVLATSVMFALAHGANPGVGGLALVNIFAAGVLLAVAVLRTGSLWFASAVHLGWNWVMAGPLDLPVSGLDLFDAPYYDGVATGPAWLGGGPFGPEGGLAGTAAAVLVLALIVHWTRPGAVLAPADSEGEAEGWRRSTG
ncbi:MAG TPA: CPBP family intramembrane glutamic endopeptidase, partial [Longimicrobiales bacterium]|nr:CPBP family intramembrane glutamic endopeptidase [Longimicrobiales bacterium]